MDGLSKMAFNNPAEISVGTITGQLESYGKIGLDNAGGVSQVRNNSDLSCGFDTGSKDKNKKTGGGYIP